MLTRPQEPNRVTLKRSSLIGALVLGLTAGRAADMSVVATADAEFLHGPAHGWDRAAPVAQEASLEETYRRQCAPCHGEQGRGDGRMARRFKPPPADFQDPEGIVKLTDDELVEVITGGRSSMPAFRDVLSEEVIRRIVTYIRELSRAPENSGTENTRTWEEVLP